MEFPKMDTSPGKFIADSFQEYAKDLEAYFAQYDVPWAKLDTLNSKINDAHARIDRLMDGLESNWFDLNSIEDNIRDLQRRVTALEKHKNTIQIIIDKED